MTDKQPTTEAPAAPNPTAGPAPQPPSQQPAFRDYGEHDKELALSDPTWKFALRHVGYYGAGPTYAMVAHFATKEDAEAAAKAAAKKYPTGVFDVVPR